jgi:hypothetical protein
MFLALVTGTAGGCEITPAGPNQPSTPPKSPRRVRRESRAAAVRGPRCTKRATPPPTTDSRRRRRPPTVLIGPWSGTRSGLDLTANGMTGRRQSSSATHHQRPHRLWALLDGRRHGMPPRAPREQPPRQPQPSPQPVIASCFPAVWCSISPLRSMSAPWTVATTRSCRPRAVVTAFLIELPRGMSIVRWRLETSS